MAEHHHHDEEHPHPHPHPHPHRHHHGEHPHHDDNGDCASSENKVYNQIREDVKKLVQEKNCGPILVRLSWHDAGTYSREEKDGGPRAVMRFETEGEAVYSVNTGLKIARGLIQDIKDKYPQVSNADFWVLTANTAIEAMGGPVVKFRPGRIDAESARESVPDGRLPGAEFGPDSIRKVFYRMGLDDRDIVALSGAHTVGRCHSERSGYEGPWTTKPLKFDNEYFIDLLNMQWTPKQNSSGNTQYEDDSGKSLMMCPSDMALIEDPEFRKYVELYANDQDAFFHDFAHSFEKLQELGVHHLKRCA